MQRDDNATIQNGIPSSILMERAAAAVLQILQRDFNTAKVLFLCGSGNNGGDGFAMARMLCEKGGTAAVCYPGALLESGKPNTAKMSAECAHQYALLPSAVPVSATLDLDGVTAVVDALFGIGLTRPIEGKFAEVIAAVNANGLPVLAVDIPSGIHADNGSVMGVAIRATATVAIAAKKRGHILYPGAQLCGRLETVDISIPLGACTAQLLTKSDLSALPSRPARAHKGTFGRTLVIGGSIGMSGAGYLAAKAAYRTGCGIVELFCPEENRIIHQIQLPEAVLCCYTKNDAAEKLSAALSRADAVAIGMGISQSNTAALLVELALSGTTVPLIVDADALNLIAAIPPLMAMLYDRSAPTVVTPHLGEMSRLAGLPAAKIGSDLIDTAAHFAKNAGVITVLKDARTVISDGEQHYLNAYGNSGMATGGSGDVLAGMIASLAAQGASALRAAYLGVLAHALAGDAAATQKGQRGMMASDLIEGLYSLL